MVALVQAAATCALTLAQPFPKSDPFGNRRLRQGRPLMPSAFPIADGLLSFPFRSLPNTTARTKMPKSSREGRGHYRIKAAKSLANRALPLWTIRLRRLTRFNGRETPTRSVGASRGPQRVPTKRLSAFNTLQEVVAELSVSGGRVSSCHTQVSSTAASLASTCHSASMAKRRSR